MCKEDQSVRLVNVLVMDAIDDFLVMGAVTPSSKLICIQ